MHTHFEELKIESYTQSSLGHLLLTRVLLSDKLADLDSKEVIEKFLKTKYFIWNYNNYPNGQNVIITNENGILKEFFGEKFFGFYETEKLDHTDFKNLNFIEFKKTISSQILNETTHDFLVECEKILFNNLNDQYEYYILEAPKEKIPEIVKEWPIYSFFHAYIAIHKKLKQITLIEFGFD